MKIGNVRGVPQMVLAHLIDVHYNGERANCEISCVAEKSIIFEEEQAGYSYFQRLM